jgi:Sulfotransferase family
VRACYPNHVDLDDLDLECRTFWQPFGLRMGSPKSGTYCYHVNQSHATPELASRIRQRVLERTAGGRQLINKNCHLSNKILFLHSLFPDAKFIHIVRETHGNIASIKLLCQRTNQGKNHYKVPFVLYWPDAEYPCWYANPASRENMPKYRRATLINRLLRRVTLIPGALEHEDPDTFRRKYPDPTRYYPGEGFARLPESWVTLNTDILRQFDQLPRETGMTVTYRQLCEDTQGTLRRIVEFCGIPGARLENVPPQLDAARGEKWRKDLTPEEVRTIAEVMERHADKVRWIAERVQTSDLVTVA